MTSASTFSNTSDMEATIHRLVDAGDETERLTQRPFPTASDKLLLHGNYPTADETAVLITQLALLQIREHSISNMRSELGGVLLGHVYQDGDQQWLHIQAALPAVSDDHGPVHFTFNADSWTQIHRDRDAHYPDLEIVGWFHTHPGLGIFYSGDDVVVHSAAFTLPWHVGLVVDPVRSECAFFGWVNGVLAPLSGFVEQLTPERPKTAADWKVVPTSVWAINDFGNRRSVTQPLGGANTAVSAQEWLTLLAGAGVVLFFFLAGWNVWLQRQIDQQRDVMLSLVGSDTGSLVASCPDPNLRLFAPMNATSYAVGDRIVLVGTADVPGATRYHVQQRLADGEARWELVGNVRLDQPLGRLTAWNSSGAQPGVYDIRLTAVDRTNLPLSNAQPCQIQINLVGPG